MDHLSFNTKYAAKYGIEEAIIIEHLLFWIEKNAANGKHFHDGRYWTYNSAGAFTKLFPFWSASQIKRILTSLERQGVILKGEFNESAYDRTRWYAFTDSFYESELLDRTISSTRQDGSELPIPDNYTGNYNNPSPSQELSNDNPCSGTPLWERSQPQSKDDNRPAPQDNPSPEFRAAPSPKKEFNTADFIKGLVDIGVEEQVARDWVKQRMAKRLSQTSTALNQAIREFNKIPDRTPNELILFAIERGWGGFKAEWFNNDIKRTKNDNGRNFSSSTADALLLKDGRKREYLDHFLSPDELLGDKGNPF